jgi:Ca-activated chloride channel family protein
MVMPWLAVLLILLAIAAGVIALRRPRPNTGAVRVAHTASIRASRRFQSRLKKYWAGAIALSVATAVVVVSAAILAARPSESVSADVKKANRDIVLCLDISGSVAEFDSEILQSFTGIVKEFDGERVALVIFNSSARTVFPLSDDYTMINEQLTDAAKALEMEDAAAYPVHMQDFLDFILGTEVGAEQGSSLVGDGLVSCSQAFDLEDQERSRTIIFATDNEVLGMPIFELPEAADLVKERDIKLYSLYIEPFGYYSDYSAELKQTTEAIGGSFYRANDASAAPTIVKEVQAQQEKEMTGGEHVTNFDKPGLWPIVIAGALGILLVVGWRFRL